jgi:hypothetical protein
VDPPRSGPIEGWVELVGVRHERVVWLAARDELARIHRKWWHAWSRLARASDAPRRTMFIDAMNPESDDLGASLRRASVIIDGLAGHFTASERETVRRTGALPDWFWSVYVGAFEDASKRR